MRKWMSLMAGLTLAAALVTYGVQANARSGGASGSKPEYDMDAAMRAREIQVVRSLGLTSVQLNRFMALYRELQAKNDELKALPRKNVERGAEINRWWNDSLQRLFSRPQYEKYVASWKMPKDFLKFATDFRKLEEAVLARVGLSTEQTRRVYAHLERMERMNEERSALVRSRPTDPWAIPNKDKEISQTQKRGMQEIMTPEQYAHYVALWQDIMAPAIADGAKLEGQLRSRQ